MGIGKILDATFSVVRRSFGRLFLVGLIAGFAPALPWLIAVVMGTVAPTSFASVAQLAIFASTILVLGIIPAAIVTLWCHMVGIGIVADVYMGRQRTLGEQLRCVGFGEYFRAIGVTILMIMLTLLGVMALVVPGIYILLVSMFVLPLIVIEKRRAGATIARAFELVRGHWWRTAFTVFILSLIHGIIVGVSAAPLEFTKLSSDPVNGGYLLILSLSAVLQWIIGAIAFGLVPAVTTLICFDLRNRKEATDLDQMSDAIQVQVTA